ncbi:MAG: pitrilysin family protein [Candidatus Thiodiazotropha sp.]|jgi:zinc protease
MRNLLIGLVLMWVVFPVQASVVEHRLENGMKVIVKQDKRAPIVVSQVWYKVGSSYEHGGITGISHVLEHMMFKGTGKHPPGEFSRIIAANGGEENAFTGQDYTAYFQTLSNDRLEVSFELEADRMRNLLLGGEEFAKEVAVVMEERRMRTEDKPQSLTYELFQSGAYQTSPYRNPIIGWMPDLENLQVDGLRVWYRKWYAPNNATLVVVGDVDPQQVIALAERYFGPLKAEPIALNNPTTEPVQHGIKRLTLKTPASQPYMIMGYKTPVLTSSETEWEPYALEMLTYILDGGSSARLASQLIRGRELAVSVDTSYDAFSRLPGMLVFDAVPRPGVSVEQVAAAIREQLERMKTELVSPEELQRVRNQIVAGKVFQRDSVFYQAMLIGRLETVGLDWHLADEYVDHLKAVTAEQIREVAQKYLVEDNLTVAVLDPLPMDGKIAVQTATGGRHVH